MEPVRPLIEALNLQPAGRQRVAAALARLQDMYGGQVQATMQEIAASADISSSQARKHVHALIAEGLLTVVGNASGGTPGLGLYYLLNHRLIKQLAACTRDLFSDCRDEDQEARDVYRFQVGRAQFLAFLIGSPGSRRVVFWRVDGERANFGDVDLKTLLRDPNVRGGWHCHLVPNGNEDAPYEQMFSLPQEAVSMLANWAQSAALGRVESLIPA